MKVLNYGLYSLKLVSVYGDKHDEFCAIERRNQQWERLEGPSKSWLMAPHITLWHSTWNIDPTFSTIFSVQG